MIVQVDINDKYLNYLETKNIEIKEYINELIEQDFYLNSEKFKNDKNKLSNRLKEIEKGNILSHEEIWKDINEL